MSKILEDLEEVVRLRLRANQEHAALEFIRTHHATIRDMAARLEAAERDAARYRWLRDRNGVVGADGYTECPVEVFIDGEAYAPGHLDAQIDAAMQGPGDEAAD